MLYSLEGKVTLTTDEGIGIDVGGIGFFVLVPKGYLGKLIPVETLEFLLRCRSVKQDLRFLASVTKRKGSFSRCSSK